MKHLNKTNTQFQNTSTKVQKVLTNKQKSDLMADSLVKGLKNSILEEQYQGKKSLL